MCVGGVVASRTNSKAVFREAQARVGLGELQTGRKMLEELQSRKPDAAVAQLLKQMSLEDKEREAKADKVFSPSSSSLRPLSPTLVDVSSCFVSVGRGSESYLGWA